MPYSSVWDNTAPLDSSAASLIGTDIRTDKIAVAERMNDILGITDFTTQAQPILGKTINLSHDTTSFIIPGTISLSLRNNLNSFDNILIADAGQVTLRNTLTISAGGQFITGGLTVITGGILISAGGMGITLGGLTISGGSLTISNTGATSTFNKNLDINAAQARIIEFNAGNSGATLTLDWNNGNNQIVTLTANCTFTFSNPQTGTWYQLRLIQDGTGTRTVTWPATTHWQSAGAAPILTTTASRTDMISLFYNGTNYLALVNGLAWVG